MYGLGKVRRVELVGSEENKKETNSQESHIQSEQPDKAIRAYNSIVDIEAIEVKAQGNKHSQIHHKDILQDIAHISNSRT